MYFIKMAVELIMNPSHGEYSNTVFKKGGVSAHVNTDSKPWKFVVKTDSVEEEAVLWATNHNADVYTNWGWGLQTTSGKTYTLSGPAANDMSWTNLQLNNFLTIVIDVGEMSFQVASLSDLNAAIPLRV